MLRLFLSLWLLWASGPAQVTHQVEPARPAPQYDGCTPDNGHGCDPTPPK